MRKQKFAALALALAAAFPLTVLAEAWDVVGMHLSAKTLDFPITPLAQSSATTSLLLTNTWKGSSWSLTNVTSGSPEFVVTSHTCSNVKPLASCQVNLVFTPSTIGSRSASLKLERSLGGLAYITLAGQGDYAVRAPLSYSGISLLPSASLDYPVVEMGKPSVTRALTITNTYLKSTLQLGSFAVAPADFSIVANSCSAVLQPKASCEVQVAFAPTAPAYREGKLTFTRTPGGATSYILRGYGLRPPMGLQASPGIVNFGTVQRGKTATQQLTLSNIGAKSYPMSNMTFSVPGVRVTSHTCGSYLATGKSCTVNLAYEPPTLGTLSGSLQLSTGTADAPAQIAVTAFAVTGVALDVAPLTAYPVPGNGTATFEITNTGFEAAALIAPQRSADELPANAFVASTTCPLSLAVGAKCSVTVAFNGDSLAPGAYVGKFSLGTADVQKTVTINATAVEANRLEVTPSSLTFAAVRVGESVAAAEPVTVTNTGSSSAPLLVSATGDGIEVFKTCSDSLEPGASCRISLVYSPTVAGVLAGKVMVSSGSFSKEVTLSGAASVASANLTVTPGRAYFASVKAGSTPSELLEIRNRGTTYVSFTGGQLQVALQGAGASAYVVKDNNCLYGLPAGQVCWVEIGTNNSTGASLLQTAEAVLTANATTSFHVPLVANQVSGAAAPFDLTTTLSGSTVLSATTTGGRAAYSFFNPTAAPIAMTAWMAHPEMKVTSTTCGGQVAPSGTCSVIVQFTPSNTVTNVWTEPARKALLHVVSGGVERTYSIMAVVMPTGFGF